MRQKVYCGTKQVLPEGYARFANRYECLKKGYGACLYAGRRGRGVPGGRRVPEQQRLLQRISLRVGLMLAVFAALLVASYYLIRRFG